MSIKKKVSYIAGIIPVVSFVLFAGVITFSVLGARDTVDAPAISNNAGIPASWTKQLAPVETNIEAKTISGSYIEYTVSVHNSSRDNTFEITHLASYLSGSGSEGFASLDIGNLEYTYFPEGGYWENVSLAHPGNSGASFKLSSALPLGTGGSARDTIYFRYDVRPEEKNGVIEDKVSALIEDQNGNLGYTTSSTAVAYSNMGTQIAEEDTPDDSTIALNEDSYTKPLGVSHYGDDNDKIEVITGTASGSVNISSFIMRSLIFVAIGLSVLILSYIIYIPISRKK